MKHALPYLILLALVLAISSIAAQHSPDAGSAPRVEWKNKCDMPGPLYAFDAATLGNKIYAIGGRGKEERHDRYTYVYDPAEDSWEVKKEPMFPRIVFLKTLASSSRAQGHPAEDIPSRFDWRDQGIMTPVKHQMNLGSCGVFAAVAVFESLIKKETGKTVDLSEQQVINGSRDFVPSGISSVDALKYIKQNGLVLEERLPYQDKKTDDMLAGPPDYRLADYQYVTTNKLALPEKIKTIKQAVRDYGPVATNMTFFQDLDRHKQGVYLYDGKSEEQGGHWVVIVGWQDAPEVKNGGYWICRNSWGEKWGENGYFNIAYGECGIDDFWFVYGIFGP